MKQSSLEKTILRICTDARSAAGELSGVSSAKINRALRAMSTILDSNRARIKRENAKDIAAGRAKGLTPAMLDRLAVTDQGIDAMRLALQQLTKLPSPVGATTHTLTRKDGLVVTRMRVPVGVVGIIYESRPNVTIDAAAICLKSHNAVILRGGSEAFHSNRVLVDLFSIALKQSGVPARAVQSIPTTDRTAIDILLRRTAEVDLVIPRGGEELIKTVMEKSLIPVIKHYKGVCHVFVSRKADLKQAEAIIVNAKVQRPGVCNAMETLLLDAELPVPARTALVRSLINSGVTLFGDAASRKLDPAIRVATEADWYAEYLDLRCAVRTVTDLKQAIEHINTYGSHHTDAIVSRDKRETTTFLTLVDSASVMCNASTRLADGGEYGLGCEIGISTDKLHARGPMGIEDLTTYKWVVFGNGHLRK